MTFEIHLKKQIGNEIGFILGEGFKIVYVSTLNITDGLLKKGDYYIPIEHILFIKEI